MARKKKAVVEADMPKEVLTTCGECAHAFGFCVRGADGLPVCCRCDQDGRNAFYRFCSARSCPSFEASGKPLPTRFPSVFHEEEAKDKVVPLFRKGEREPWKLVPSREVPPDGISWDGSAFRM